MKWQVKLGATLTFDSESERDIVHQLESLKKQHKLGTFISNAIRITLEHPELLEEQQASLDQFGLTDNRKRFFDACTEEIERMKEKVDKIFDMASDLYILNKFNKRIGMEDRSKNLMMAQFIVKKQVRDLCQLLGVTKLMSPYTSERLYAVDKNADGVLEFIVNYYDTVVNEIKSAAVGVNSRSSQVEELDQKLRELEKLYADKATSNKADGSDTTEDANKTASDESEDGEIEFDLNEGFVDTEGIMGLLGDI